jgi:hypothetical protein
MLENAYSRKAYDAAVRRAQESRSRLLERLGGECAKCGATENLELDHPFGREWVARDKNRWVRMKLYWQDYESGNLRILCERCNKLYVPDTPF